ncbi:MAG TPA: ABC transporter permease [Bacteroides clarus]|jgi:ABC-2 type transport system permease protein|uniref:ABC transporter permease n=1 Tax=Bacteroides clarus TaxID=626929 RepID=UPI0018AA590B|nr:ABC transporter permease [Bacteroides clarus]HJF98852.1 ABC transporter permease [Bacteroides clarus]
MKQLTFKQKVVQGIHDLFYIWKQEFRTTFRDQGVLIFFVLVPLVYPLIYSFIYTNETIREVPTVVVDNSRSSLSREYLRKVDASPETSIVAHCADMEEAKLMLKDRKAYGIIYIPAHFSDDIARGKQTQVSIFCDMSGLLYYKALLTANTNVSLAMNADIKMKRAGNTTARQDEITAYPIEYEDVAIFNPTNGFAAFLIPAVLILIIQQTLLLGIGLSAGTAREQNRFKDLVPINRHYNGTLRIVMGKGLSYFMVYSLVAVYILCVVPRLFSLNQIAIPGVLTLFALPYLAACIFFAMTVSIAIRNRETCMLLFVFTSVPLLFLSGISWPGAAMPEFWRYFSYIFPSTFGINGYVRINSMGATLNEVSFEYQALWIQTGIYFLTTCLVYRWQIIQSRKKLGVSI